MANRYESFRPEVIREIKRRINRTLEAIGVFVEGEAVVRSPVDTGNLKGSWNHKVDEENMTVHIGSNVEYAVFVEKGTSRQVAQRVVTGAAEDNQARIQQLAEEMMRFD
ncbi:HK97 gp10 family phage protein [Paenibacillus sp. sgz302251]|uniref:HK97 gp10 family phage protein n=1 Tax=Paenibacillus sp. sgz302251 TaxID=3414493 RepID=UPI003C79E255